MKATSPAYQRSCKDQCGLGLLLSQSQKITAFSRLTTNIQAMLMSPLLAYRVSGRRSAVTPVVGARPDVASRRISLCRASSYAGELIKRVGESSEEAASRTSCVPSARQKLSVSSV